MPHRLPASSPAHDETHLLLLIADQMSAIAAKDLDRILKHHAADVIVFDVKPPFQIVGSLLWRQTWAACLPNFPDGCQTEMRDLGLHLSGDVALAHWLWRLTSSDRRHRAHQTWMRTSMGFRRLQGRWQIVHEHASVPFDPDSAKAVFVIDLPP